VTRGKEVSRLVAGAAPDLVIHSAAVSHPDACERDPEAAAAVIVDGSRNVARAARTVGARLVHLSTDLVFDGERGCYTETDAVRGISVYSRSKIEAESEVAAADPSAVILRVAVMYGRGNPHYLGLLDTMLSAWRAGRALVFYTDQFRTPTFAPQVAEAVRSLAARGNVSGVFHLGGAERLSRYEFARIVAEEVGAPDDLVRPGSMFDSPGPARRGADCSLRSDKIRQVLGIEPVSCREGLRVLAARGQLERIALER
jgi:dTDP-4-dehydrorhamnose reductase